MLETTKTRILLVMAMLAVSGCSALARPDESPRSETPMCRPPTQAATVQPAPTTEPIATPTGQPGSSVDCQNNLAFIADQTILDGTVVSPESTLDKRWEVENNGDCSWDVTYRVRLIAGPDLGAQPEQALYPARGGSRVVIRMLFKAPGEPGNYRSAWQAVDPQGEPFGDPFFIDITVQGTP